MLTDVVVLKGGGWGGGAKPLQQGSQGPEL